MKTTSPTEKSTSDPPKKRLTGLQALIQSVGYVSPQCAMGAVMCAGRAFEPIIKHHANAVGAITGTSTDSKPKAATIGSYQHARILNTPNSSSQTVPYSPLKTCKSQPWKTPRKKHSSISKTQVNPLSNSFGIEVSPW